MGHCCFCPFSSYVALLLTSLFRFVRNLYYVHPRLQLFFALSGVRSCPLFQWTHSAPVLEAPPPPISHTAFAHVGITISSTTFLKATLPTEDLAGSPSLFLFVISFTKYCSASLRTGSKCERAYKQMGHRYAYTFYLLAHRTSTGWCIYIVPNLAVFTPRKIQEDAAFQAQRKMLCKNYIWCVDPTLCRLNSPGVRRECNGFWFCVFSLRDLTRIE